MATKGPYWSRGCQLLKGWRGEREQTEIASLLSMDKSAYYRFENGVRRPGGKWSARIDIATSGAVPAVSWWKPAVDERSARKSRRAA